MPISKKILVTAATGNQGGGVVRHCLRDGHQVFAYVRDVSSPKAQELSELGATLIHGDFDSLEALHSAMKGMDAAFFIEKQTGDWAGDLQRSTNIITVAKSSGTVRHMFASTAINTGQHESFPGWGPDYPMYRYWMNKHMMEERVRGAGFDRWTILRPAHCLQNFKSPVSSVLFPRFKNERILQVAWLPDTKLPWFDASDVGIVVAAALAEPDKYAGREIDLAAEALTTEQMAVKLSKALQTEVKVHFYTDEEKEILGKTGHPAINAAQWANDVPGEGAVGKIPDLPLTIVDEFLRLNSSQI